MHLLEQWELDIGNWTTVGGFFGGMLLIAFIDKFIPKQSNPHELKRVEEMKQPRKCSTG